ncbi:AIPR family protein [Lysobacter arenosi]|uniref:AIPR family protein n=1 Tax=Lysobacter arenosi TaxID=2795387 RepID=A0ABX7RCI0_9GAMM|nr:AIPR family protein [Lysobacter arenosi]QSX74606.1 AIPR family protein [Lysobacter arenosi]
MSGRDLQTFYGELEADVTTEANPAGGLRASFREDAFVRIVADDLEQAGVLESPTICHHEWGQGNTSFKVNGYGFPEEDSRLDVVVAEYRNVSERPDSLTSADIERAFRRVDRYLARAWDGLFDEIDVADERRSMAEAIHARRQSIDRIRIILVTNARQSQRKEATFKEKIRGVEASYDIWDIERIRRLREGGVVAEALEVDLTRHLEQGLVCTRMNADERGHHTCVSLLPGKVLADLYDEHGARLLELNVRSYLQARGKVNKGILETIRERPGDFVAYNNGVTIVAEEIVYGRTGAGQDVIRSIKGLQIVNGGQTTASLHRAKSLGASLDDVFVQAKVIQVDRDRFFEVVPLISRFSNSQNKVSEVDLSASHPFHVAFERVSRREWTPGLASKWFYERTRGGYQTARSREGTTAARMRDFDSRHPTSQRLTKEELARSEVAWRAMPHIVSLGAQKCFTHFMSSFVDPASRAADFDISTEIYRRHIAKAILFREVHAIVRSIQEITKYRINVAIYTLSLITNASARRIDLDRIWQTQQISPALTSLVTEWAPVVLEKMKEVASTLSYEEAESFKKSAFWDRLRAFEWTIPTSVDSELVAVSGDADGGAVRPRKGRTVAPLSSEHQSNIARTLEISADDWLKIAAWGRETGELEQWKLGLVTTLASYAAQGRKAISEKQALHAASIIAKARESGVI